MAKKVSGGTGANQYTKEQVGQNDQPAKGRGTALQVASQNHVGEKTVRRAEQFKKGVDAADSISPGLGKKIRSGEAKVSKQIMEKLGKADQSTQKEVVQDIKEGKPEKAKKKLDPWSVKIELAEGDSYPTTTILKKASTAETSKEDLQEVWLNNLTDIMQALKDSLDQVMTSYFSTNINEEGKGEAIIILNDMDCIIRKAKEQIQSTTKEKE